MSQEFETAMLGSVGGLSKPTSSSEPNEETQECRNCGAPVHRKFCGNCGQLAQNFHKPIGHLIGEVLSDFFSLDGRVAKTLPALLFMPGRITRSYLDGKRQRYVPPFRLYLLSSFIFFLVFFSVGQSKHWFDLRFDPVMADDAAVTQTTDVKEPAVIPEDVSKPALEDGAADDVTADVTDDTKDLADGHEGISLDPGEILKADGRVNREYLDQALDDMVSSSDEDISFLKGLAHVGADVYDNPKVFLSAVQNWAPRLALGITPAMILCLIIVYPFRQGVYVYDHVITSLHFQTWLYLLTTIVMVLFWLGVSAGWWLFFLAPPIYIYRLMRCVYGAGRILGILRTLFILSLLTVFFVFWILVVFALSANETADISRQLTQN